MKEKKPLVVNLTPFNVEVFTRPNGFTLQFQGRNKNRRPVIVKAHFDSNWWAGVLAKKIAEVLTAAQQRVDDLKHAVMRHF